MTKPLCVCESDGSSMCGYHLARGEQVIRRDLLEALRTERADAIYLLYNILRYGLEPRFVRAAHQLLGKEGRP